MGSLRKLLHSQRPWCLSQGKPGVGLRDVLVKNEMNLRVWVDVRGDFHISS